MVTQGGHRGSVKGIGRGGRIGKMYSVPTVKQAFGRAAHRESFEGDGQLANNLMDLDEGTLNCCKEDKHRIRKTLLPEWKDTREHGWKNDDWVPGYRTFFKIFDNNNNCGRPMATLPGDKDTGQYVMDDRNESPRMGDEEIIEGGNENCAMQPPAVIRQSAGPRHYGRYSKEFKHINPDDARFKV